MHEGTLGVHEIELVVHAGQDTGNGGGVGHHAHGALDLGNVAARNNGGGLVVDTNLEGRGAPVNELDGALGLDGDDSSVNVLGDNISSVHHAASHVLSVAGVALNHHVCRLKDAVGDLGD